MQKVTKRALAALAVAGMITAGACGNDDDANNASGSSDTTETTMAKDMASTDQGAEGAAASVTTPAADLRAGLTYLLQEHVYLAGIAVTQGVGKGLDSGEFKASAATLDKNSVALAEAIGSVYGKPAGDQFLELWRKHIGMFVEYTKGKATGDEALAKKAAMDLDGYRNDFAAFLSSANPELTKQAVADSLVPHVKTLSAAIDSVVAGDGQAFAKLREAAQAMPPEAKILAGAIAKQNAEKIPGAAEGAGPDLRAGLTSLLSEHVYLAGIAVVQGTEKGLDSAEFKAAAGTLDTNSVALADAVGSVYGKPAGDQFLELWRKHIGMFVDYTKGKATGDEALAKKAAMELDGYRADFAAFLASANPNLTKDAVADSLVPHVKTLSAAIDSVVAKDGKAFDKLSEAAGVMPAEAKILAEAIAKQKL